MRIINFLVYSRQAALDPNFELGSKPYDLECTSLVKVQRADVAMAVFLLINLTLGVLISVSRLLVRHLPLFGT